MRRRSNLFATEIGLALSLGLVITAFTVETPRTDGPGRTYTVPDVVPDELVEIVPTRHVRELPTVPPSPLPPVEAPDGDVVVTDYIEDDVILTLDPAPTDDALTLTPPTPPDGLPVLDPPPDDEVVDFLPFEQMPRLDGGIEGLQRRIRYPELCRAAGLEGRVFIHFIVEKDGRVSEAEVVRGIGGGCDEAALAAVQTARFTPGHQRGHPVRVRMSLPVTFRLH